MSFFSAIEPAVIDLELLSTAIHNQLDVDAQTRLSKLILSGLGGAATTELIKVSSPPPMHNVTSLSLGYKNILKIENLFGFRALTKLCLDNNLIEKIENLSSLVNLQWLDLSFNKISKIEGLEGLVNLTDLNLFQNQIDTIEGLDDLSNLSFLSIGNNNISQLDNIKYLSRFEQLKSLNIDGNPVTSDTMYYKLSIAIIPNIKYLNYQLIKESNIQAAIEELHDVVQETTQKRVECANSKSLLNKELINKERKSQLHLNEVENLYQMLISENPELSQLSCLAEDEVNLKLKPSQSEFTKITQELEKFLECQRKQRLAEVEEFLKCVGSLKAKNETKSQLIIKQLRKHSKSTHPENTLEVNLRMQKAYQQLMSLEMSCYEQIDDVFKELEQNYSHLLAHVVDGTRQIFQKYRPLETEMFETVTDVLTKAFDQLLNADVDDTNEKAQGLLSNKDLFLTLISATHERFMAILERVEENLVNNLNRECEMVLNDIQTGEWKRNRDRIMEIKAFCKT